MQIKKLTLEFSIIPGSIKPGHKNFSSGVVNSSPSNFQVSSLFINKKRNKEKIDFKESYLLFKAI